MALTLRNTTSATDPVAHQQKVCSTPCRNGQQSYTIEYRYPNKINKCHGRHNTQLGGALDVNGQNITSASSRKHCFRSQNGTGEPRDSNVTVEDGTHDFDIASQRWYKWSKIRRNISYKFSNRIKFIRRCKQFVPSNYKTQHQLGGDLDPKW